MIPSVIRLLVPILILLISWTGAVPKLVPSRRSLAFDRRGMGLEQVIPQNIAELNYALVWHHPPSAVISFVAYDGHPILLLEDINHLAEVVSCQSPQSGSNETLISVQFTTKEAFTAASDVWFTSCEFVLLTAHPSCNAPDERGAWTIISATQASEVFTVTLIAKPISMREVGRSFHVRYAHTGASEWSTPQTIGPRDTHSIDVPLVHLNYEPKIPTRLTLFPPDLSIDDTVDSAVTAILSQAGIDLTCVDCNMRSNVTIGMDFEIDLGDATCAIDPADGCVTITQAGMNLTISELELTAALEVSLERSLFHKGTSYKILSVPAIPELNVPPLINIGPNVGLEVAFNLDVSGKINFTYGATAQVPSGAFAAIELVNKKGNWDPSGVANGWDNSEVKQIPFRVNDGSLNVTASVALAPYAEISFVVVGIGAYLRITQNVPQVVVSADLVDSVNRECRPIGKDDYESFSIAFLVGADMRLSTVGSVALGRGLSIGRGSPLGWNQTLWSHDLPLLPAPEISKPLCFVVTDDHSGSNKTAFEKEQVNNFLPGYPAPTGTLFPAASAIPTWNIPGIKSYYRDHGNLPSNVNYQQMVQATTVPDDIKAAVSAAAQKQKESHAPRTFSLPCFRTIGGLLSIVLVVLSCVV